MVTSERGLWGLSFNLIVPFSTNFVFNHLRRTRYFAQHWRLTIDTISGDVVSLVIFQVLTCPLSDLISPFFWTFLSHDGLRARTKRRREWALPGHRPPPLARSRGHTVHDGADYTAATERLQPRQRVARDSYSVARGGVDRQYPQGTAPVSAGCCPEREDVFD